MVVTKKKTKPKTTSATLTFSFLDGTSMAASFPRQKDTDPLVVAANVKKAIDREKIVVEVDGKLLIIPMTSVKVITLDPMPDHLPANVIRGGKSAKVS